MVKIIKFKNKLSQRMKRLRKQNIHTLNKFLWVKKAILILIKDTKESITDDTRKIIVVTEG